MTEFNIAEESAQLLRLTSNAYTLTVRQGPERGKAFSGPKEKDRKPVDPPPIIQLQIRDPTDPASNYLQSPYFFMCCNLCDADLSRPGQLSAALQGDESQKSSQSALAGTLVSSLHRLKDVDNSDGGFFVFPDISVRVEGEFRLRFSLFEMLKTAPKVIYIKSVTTEPFTVYAPRTFPGMSESTFLSRSFGDQGVKLRIRKEPRVLGKRTAPSEPSSSETPQPYNPQRANYAGMGLQPQQVQTQGFPPEYRGEAAGYDESPSKRQRSVVDTESQAAYLQEERPVQRSMTQSRDSLNQYRESQVPTQRANYYVPQPLSAQSSEFPVPGHQRTLSSSTSSPFESPRAEYPTFGYPNQTQIFQQARDATFQYQFRQGQQIAPLVPPERQVPSSVPSQTGQFVPYGRQDEQYTDLRYPPQRLNASNFANPQATYAAAGQQGIPRTLPQPPQGTTTSGLPSIATTFAQPQYDTANGGGAPDAYPTATAGQGYANFAYRGRE